MSGRSDELLQRRWSPGVWVEQGMLAHYSAAGNALLHIVKPGSCPSRQTSFHLRKSNFPTGSLSSVALMAW